MKKYLICLIFCLPVLLIAQSAELPVKEKGEFIEFEIVNTSFQKIHAFVKGPKKNGENFSYGLNLFPKVPRKENWSVGTKLYSVNKLGIKKLIYEVTAADEAKTVKISPKG